MSLRYPSHAKINPSAPRAIGVCDFCGQQWNLSELAFQYYWFGNDYLSSGFRVCPPCYDVAAVFNRPIILGPDPIPVIQPRPEQYSVEEGPAPSPVPYVPPEASPVPVED